MNDRSEDTRESIPLCRQRAFPTARVRLACFLSLAVVVGLGVVTAPAARQVHAAEAGAEEGTSERTFLDNVKAGGWIGGIIIICSIVGVSLSLTYLFQIRRDALVPPELLGQVEELFNDEEYEEAFHVCEANPSFLSTILMAGLSRLDEGYDEIQKAVQDTGEVETMKLYQKIGYISLIASVAPMLGLFGTVSGMIGTFNVIASSQVQPKPSDLADGISEALVTTFMGLLVAIPMTVIYAIYRNLISNVVLEVGEVTEDLMGRFKGPGDAEQAA